MELKKFIAGFAEQFDDTELEEFTPDCNYQDLDEWSSLTALSIIAFVKTECGKTINAREIRSCKSIEELFNLVESK